MANETVYILNLHLVDGRQITLLETTTLVEVQEAYAKADNEWVASTAEKRPYRLPPEFLHSMAPNLIIEIKVDQIPLSEYERIKNPYQQQLAADGFAKMFNTQK